MGCRLAARESRDFPSGVGLTLCDPWADPRKSLGPVPLHLPSSLNPAITRRCRGLVGSWARFLDLACSVRLHMALLPPSGSSLVAAVGLQCRRDNAQGVYPSTNLTNIALDLDSALTLQD